jgi:hypothetical protein
LAAPQLPQKASNWEGDAKGESSNSKEFENIVEMLKEEAWEENVFLFADNSTAESALYKRELLQ